MAEYGQYVALADYNPDTLVKPVGHWHNVTLHHTPTAASGDALVRAHTVRLFKIAEVASRVLILLGLFAMLVRACRGVSFAELGLKAASYARRWQGRWRGNPFKDKTAARTTELFIERRVERARVAILWGMILLTFTLCIWSWTLFVWRGDFTCSTADRIGGQSCDFAVLRLWLWESELLPILVIYPVILLLFVAPTWLTPTTLDMLNIHISAVLVGVLLVEQRLKEPRPGWRAPIWTQLARACQTVTCGNARLSILLQLLLVVSQINLGSPKSSAVSESVFILSLFLIFDRMAWVAARAIQQAERASHSEDLVVKLLQSMHDAVLHVNLDLRITRPSADLAAVLMHASPDGQKLNGTSFLDICHESERTQVEQRLGESAADQTELSVHTMMAKLRDAHGLAVSVELIWTFLPGEDECFVLGIKEAVERAPPSAAQRMDAPTEPRANSSTVQGPLAPNHAFAAFAALQSTGLASSVEESSDGTTTESASSLGSTDAGRAQPTAIVNRESFLIAFASTGFTKLSGLEADDDLRLAFFDPRKFEKWWVNRSNHNFAFPQDDQLDLFADIFTVKRWEMSQSGGRRRVKKFKSEKIYEVVIKVGWDPNGLTPVTVVDQTRLGFRTGPYTVRMPDSRLVPFDANQRGKEQALEQPPGDEDTKASH